MWMHYFPYLVVESPCDDHHAACYRRHCFRLGRCNWFRETKRLDIIRSISILQVLQLLRNSILWRKRVRVLCCKSYRNGSIILSARFGSPFLVQNSIWESWWRKSWFPLAGIPFAAIRALAAPNDELLGPTMAHLRTVKLVEVSLESIPQMFFQAYTALRRGGLSFQEDVSFLDRALKASILTSLLQVRLVKVAWLQTKKSFTSAFAF